MSSSSTTQQHQEQEQQEQPMPPSLEENKEEDGPPASGQRHYSNVTATVATMTFPGAAPCVLQKPPPPLPPPPYLLQQQHKQQQQQQQHPSPQYAGAAAPGLGEAFTLPTLLNASPTVPPPPAAAGPGTASFGCIESLKIEMEEFLNSMDKYPKQEYMEAMEAVPELVQEETPFINFLRTDDFDPIKASLRLTSYWKYRKQIYGSDRWLLPLKCTGTGALPHEGIDFMLMGCMTFISTPSPVLIVDTSRCVMNRMSTATTDQELIPVDFNHIVLQWLMYFVTVASNAEKTNRPMEEYTLIHKVSPGNRMIFAPDAWVMARAALPMRIKPHSIAAVTALQPDHFHLRQFLQFQASRMIEYNSRKSVRVFLGDVNNEWDHLLKKCSISKSSLPVSLGGHLDNDFHIDQLRSRVSIESIMASAPPITNARLGHFVPLALHDYHGNYHQQQHRLEAQHSWIAAVATHGNARLLEDGSPQVNSSIISSKGTPGERRKQRNADYQKSYVMREENKRMMLRGQCKRETARKEQLQAECKRLEDLLKQAYRLVAKYGSLHDESLVILD